MKNKNSSPMTAYMIGIMALFMAGFLLLVFFGARTFRGAARGQEGNYNARNLVGYISTCVKARDRTGAVSVRDSAYGDVLVIKDGSKGYALHIYKYDGKLVEEFSKLDAEPRPEKATVIGDTGLFDAKLEGSLLTVRTDAGTAQVRLRATTEGGLAG